MTVITDMRTLPVGTRFHVDNGGWEGEITVIDGIKHIYVVATGKFLNLSTRSDDECELSIRTEQGILPEEVEYRERMNKETVLYNADENCDHQIEPQWSGIKCVKCGGWYCL